MSKAKASTASKSASARDKRPKSVPKTQVRAKATPMAKAPSAKRRPPSRASAQSKARTVAKTTTAPAKKPAAARSANPKPPVASKAASPAVKKVRALRGSPLAPSIPSSLDYANSATAARSGAEEIRHNRAKHTDTSPALTGGDIDASWEEASSTGDEAPGGDNLTPDQDVVEEIGSALGIEYADDEELQGGVELENRDRHRWEYDPASADDYVDRLKNES